MRLRLLSAAGDTASSSNSWQQAADTADRFINSLVNQQPNSSSSSSNHVTVDSQPTSTCPPAARTAVPRGPHLAQVELAKRRLQLGLCDAQHLAEAIAQCAGALGHLVSCAADLRGYVVLLEGSARMWLSHSLALSLQQAGGLGLQGKEAVLGLRRQVAAYQVLRHWVDLL